MRRGGSRWVGKGGGEAYVECTCYQFEPSNIIHHNVQTLFTGADKYTQDNPTLVFNLNSHEKIFSSKIELFVIKKNTKYVCYVFNFIHNK